MGKSEGSLRTFAKRNGYRLIVLSGTRASHGKYKITDAKPGRSWPTDIRANSIDSTRRILSRAVRDNKKAARRRQAEIDRINAAGR